MRVFLKETSLKLAQDLTEKETKSLISSGYTKNRVLTLATAKELSMMENNLKGKENRSYQRIRQR